MSSMYYPFAFLFIYPLIVSGEAGPANCNSDTLACSSVQAAIKVDSPNCDANLGSNLQADPTMLLQTRVHNQLAQTVPSEKQEAEKQQDDLEEEEYAHNQQYQKRDIDGMHEDVYEKPEEFCIGGKPACAVEGVASGRRRRKSISDAILPDPSLVIQTKPALNINIRIHLTPNFKVVSSKADLPGIEMYSWLTEENILEILNHPYGPNAAYAKAGITFTLLNITTHDCVGLGTCNSIPTQTRWGTFSPWCAKALISELDKSTCSGCNMLIRDSIYAQLPLNVTSHKDPILDIWWFPFAKMGGAGSYTGFAGRNFVYMGQWYDSYGGKVRRRPLSSLAKKLSHEIGHGLSLDHSTPEQKLVIPTRMMSGGQAWTSGDVQAARDVASTGRGYCWWASCNTEFLRRESTPFGEGSKSVADPEGDLSNFAFQVCSSDRRRMIAPKCEKTDQMQVCQQSNISKCVNCEVYEKCRPKTSSKCRRRRYGKCASCTPWDDWDSTTTTTPSPRCAPDSMQTCRRRRWSRCSNCVQPSPLVPGYSIEHLNKWCTVMTSSDPISTNICNGTRIDCYEKGAALCDATPSCLGVAVSMETGWTLWKKGVKLCLSETIKPNDGDWNVIMKATTTTQQLVGSTATTTQASTIGATTSSGSVSFQICGSSDATLTCHYEYPAGSSLWYSFEDIALPTYSNGIWMCSRWTQGNPTYSIRLTLNGASHITNEDTAVAHGAVICPTTTTTTTTQAAAPSVTAVGKGTYSMSTAHVGHNIWNDRSYTFTTLPVALEGALLFQGPHRIPDGDVITLDCGGSTGSLFALLQVSRGGTFPTTLVADGWTFLPEWQASWVFKGTNNFHVYEKQACTTVLPASSGHDVLAVFLFAQTTTTTTHSLPAVSDILMASANHKTAATKPEARTAEQQASNE